MSLKKYLFPSHREASLGKRLAYFKIGRWYFMALGFATPYWSVAHFNRCLGMVYTGWFCFVWVKSTKAEEKS